MFVCSSDTLVHELFAGSKGNSKWKRNAHAGVVIVHSSEGNSTLDSSHTLKIDIIPNSAT